jgi:hypothetical protein
MMRRLLSSAPQHKTPIEKSASALAREFKAAENIPKTPASIGAQIQRIMIEYSRLQGFMWGSVAAALVGAYGIAYVVRKS